MTCPKAQGQLIVWCTGVVRVNPTRLAIRIMAEGQTFMVVCGDAKLKLTAKPKVLSGPFNAKIVSPFLLAINKKLADKDQIMLEMLESCIVHTQRGKEIAAFRISEAAPMLDLSMPVESLVPPGSAGEILNVELAARAQRAFKITCCGVTLTANLPGQFTHLPLHETVVKKFVMDYNEKVNSERKGAKCKVTLEADVSDFKIGGRVIDIYDPVCALLAHKGETHIEMSLTPEAYAKWGYDNPKAIGGPEAANAAAKPSAPKSQVFLVRCGAVELKLTLPEKALAKSLQDGVLMPFLGAYAKRVKRATPYTISDVRRVEVDGLSVAPTLKASSVVRRQDAPPAPPPVDPADHTAYLAAVEAAKERGASDAELAHMSQVYLKASHERENGKPAPAHEAPTAPEGPPPTRVEVFLRSEPAQEPGGQGATPTSVVDLSSPRAAGAAPAETGAARPNPNVDYSKWANLDDEDEEDAATALSKAEQAAQTAQMVADATASNALAAAGGRVDAVSPEARAEVTRKVQAAELAKAHHESLKSAADAKARAKAKAEKEAAAAAQAATRAPSGRTVVRRKWSDWDKVKLDLSDDEDVDSESHKESSRVLT